MVAGSLADAGYYQGDNYIRPNSSNPKGFFEGREINSINERILETIIPTRPSAVGRIGQLLPIVSPLLRNEQPCRGMGQLWLATMPIDTKVGQSIKPEIAAAIALQTSKKPFCLKDPRFCYTLPAWIPSFDLDRTIFLCVFRHPGQVVESIIAECRRRRYLNTLAISRPTAAKIWLSMYEHVLVNQRIGGQWQFLHYEQMFDAEFVGMLSGMIDAPVSTCFADRRLQRSREGSEVGVRAMVMYEKLCELASFSHS